MAELLISLEVVVRVGTIVMLGLVRMGTGVPSSSRRCRVFSRIAGVR